jgi:UPF0716 protein FxsA
VLETLAALVLISVVGAWLAKREGVGVLRRVQTALIEGRVPTAEVTDGALVLFAGALMLTPGFLTDLLALVLLVPPSRAVVRRAMLQWFRKRASARASFEVVDAESWEDL